MCCAVTCRCVMGVCGTDCATLAAMMKMASARGASINSVAFSPDGTKIVSGSSGSSDQSIQLWGVLPCARKLHLLSGGVVGW